MQVVWCAFFLSSFFSFLLGDAYSPIIQYPKEDEPEFRYDYTYNDEVKGWFKLHRVPVKWYDADDKCKLEGAELATPTDFPTLMVMLNTIDKKVHRAFTGIHSIFSHGDFYSTKGIPLGRMPIAWAPDAPLADITKRCAVLVLNGTLTTDDCNTPYPYICFKKHDSQPLGECGTTDKGYTYSLKTKTCYKFHTEARAWHDAFKACSSEGGHLAVINSEDEAQELVLLIQKYPANMIRSDENNYVFIGVIDLKRLGEWATIHGDTLKEAGYSKWATTEPNNIHKNEFCGSMIRSGGLNDISCESKLSFVCEKKPDSLVSEKNSTSDTNFILR